MKTRELTNANAEVVAQSHVVCHAAYIAWQLGRKLTFDPVKGRIRRRRRSESYAQSGDATALARLMRDGRRLNFCQPSEILEVTIMIRSSLMFALLTLTLFVDGSVSPAQQPLPAEGDETQLLAILESDAEMFDKAKACQRLAIIGTSKSVPVLATLLGDEKISHYARFGLESNPSPDVDDAFRNALGDLSGQPLVGVINSIGTRRDAMATSALVELANSDDESIASAAISSLGPSPHQTRSMRFRRRWTEITRCEWLQRTHV